MQETAFRSATGTSDAPILTPASAANPLPVVAVPRAINAVFTTLTRPANTTSYLANESISDNATAGSVTALSATVSDTNDAPVAVTSIELDTSDTGLGGVSVRAWVYNSNPTASAGVGGGDNAAFSNKKAGLVATFVGTLHAMSDGAKGFLAPEDTGPPVLPPTSGARTLFIQYQTLGAFTPSANSTTLIGTARGYQLRA